MGNFYKWLIKESKEDYINHNFSIDDDPSFTVRASFDTAKENDELNYWIDSVKTTAKQFKEYVNKLLTGVTATSDYSDFYTTPDPESLLRIRNKLYLIIASLNNVIECNSFDRLDKLHHQQYNIEKFCISNSDINLIGKFYLFKDDINEKLEKIVLWMKSLIEISELGGEEILKNIYKNHDDKEEQFLLKIKENKTKITNLIGKINYNKLNNNSKVILDRINDTFKYNNLKFLENYKSFTKFDYLQLTSIYHSFKYISLDNLDIGQKTIQFRDTYNNFVNSIKSFIIAFHRKYGTLARKE